MQYCCKTIWSFVLSYSIFIVSDPFKRHNQSTLERILFVNPSRSLVLSAYRHVGAKMAIVSKKNIALVSTHPRRHCQSAIFMHVSMHDATNPRPTCPIWLQTRIGKQRIFFRSNIKRTIITYQPHIQQHIQPINHTRELTTCVDSLQH